MFSFLSHKEFRFLLPILPVALIICIVVILLINIPLSVYMGLIHQSGTTDATLHLSNTVNNDSKVLFLMPCHSAPYYSYIHRNISMKFLSCEPNFNNAVNYTDEADVFFFY
ncbi:GPI mannosyltransferase 3 [Caerostris extrusa]|uniref:Mannosyltransferase n=1 Tax=Caerostris extrusa TaxID=172846 RepID=A0AAV4Y313_CAEEX|nr:GPI mannosyltransferase 3 [Caerostris extrusa]